MTTALKTGTRLQTGLAADTPVMTLKGPTRVDALAIGDRIVTRRGVRRLKGLEISERHDADVIRIRASALGHARPETDITIACDQPLLVRDWRARAMFGVDTAAIPAGRLADGEYISRETVEVLRAYRLVFDTAEVVYAQGCELPMGEFAACD